MPDMTHTVAESRDLCASGPLRFVVQKHWASRLHYDFRLEWDGTMKSWAIPKGPSYDPHDKRLAVPVPDHPLSYNQFEGEIAQGNYGAGRVMIWDKGCWEPLQDPHEGWAQGRLEFKLHGHKLTGTWTLIRMQPRRGRSAGWLLVKERDGLERPAQEFDVVQALPESVSALPDCPAAAPQLSSAAPVSRLPLL